MSIPITPDPEAPTPINFAIIGCTRTVPKMARAIALAPDAVLTAIGGSSYEEAWHFMRDNAHLGFNGVQVPIHLGPYEAVIEKPFVNAVYVAVSHSHWAVFAASKKKHVLIEVPNELTLTELDLIQQECTRNCVQFMDSMMWLHHPRTQEMRQIISNPSIFGNIKMLDSLFSFNMDTDVPTIPCMTCPFRLLWYCISASLWANSCVLPGTVIALYDAAGFTCGARLLWLDGQSATLHGTYSAHLTLQMTVIGTKGTIHVTDFAIPYEEGNANFQFVHGMNLNDLEVTTEIPQEARMVQKFANLAQSIGKGEQPDWFWPDISRKNMIVIDAIRNSVMSGWVPIEINN